MNAQDDVDKIRQIMKLIWEVAKDTGAGFISADAVMKPRDGSRPFVICAVRDTQFMFTEEEGFCASYVPHEKTEKWVMDFDPERIETFDEPPKRKEP